MNKKNSHGRWQTRYFYLNNEFLIYKKDHSSTEIKGAVDVGDIAEFAASNKGYLTIHMNGGEVLELKGADSREIGNWIAAMEERREWVLSERALLKRAAAEVTAASSSGTSDACVMTTKAGWLMKKSNNKYGGMQVSTSCPRHSLVCVCVACVLWMVGWMEGRIVCYISAMLPPMSLTPPPPPPSASCPGEIHQSGQ